MHRLTIEAAHAVLVTHHADHAAAHGHLLRHAVAADYYLCTVTAGSAHSAYELLALAENSRRPHLAGHATITPAAAAST